MTASHPNPSRPIAVLVVLVAAFMAASLFTRDAFADNRPRQLDVRFTELDARVERGKLHVAYEIERRDWQELKRLHIQPRLNLYAPSRPGTYEFIQSVEVTSPSATFIFPHAMSPDRARFVELRLSGERGRSKIATTSYRSDRGSRVRVAVDRDGPRRGHGHNRGPNGGGGQVAIIEACSRNTTWSGDLNQCITKANNVGHGAPALIDACGSATTWSGDFFSCIDLAAALPHNPHGTIEACSTATTWSGDFKTCMQSAAAYRGDASQTIAACKAATTWSGDFKVCLDEARTLGPRAPRVVDACSAATSWSGEFKQCLVAARRT